MRVVAEADQTPSPGDMLMNPWIPAIVLALELGKLVIEIYREQIA